jgi:hypothetical protein
MMKRASYMVTLLVLALLTTAGGVLAAANNPFANHFEAHLIGGEEVPANDSQAAGQAVFNVVDGGNAIEYRLIVANIDNVAQSHIHLGPAGCQCPVVVFLYPSAPPAVLIPGTTNGVLMTGTITAANLRGSLAGQPLSVLINHMAAGNTYVNVHTSHLPGGEIRGQIK